MQVGENSLFYRNDWEITVVTLKCVTVIYQKIKTKSFGKQELLNGIYVVINMFISNMSINVFSGNV